MPAEGKSAGILRSISGHFAFGVRCVLCAGAFLGAGRHPGAVQTLQAGKQRHSQLKSASAMLKML